MRPVVSLLIPLLLALPMFGEPAGVRPPGIRHALQPARVLALTPLTGAERARLAAPSPRLRTGIHRALPASLAMAGDWALTADGSRVWRVSFHSPGATGIRLELFDANLGHGRLWVYNGSQVAGPYTGRGAFNDGHFWTASIFADSITLEYEPDPTLAPGAPLPFEIRTLSHQTVAMADAPGSAGAVNPVPDSGSGDAADYCELDPNCYPDWQSSMASVAELTFEEPDGLRYACSGSLVATRDNSQKPYLLTAGHCIHDETAARSLEVFWTYQTNRCTGPLPNRATSTVSSTGANLLAWSTMDKGDYSFLLLKDIPKGVAFAMWDPSDPPDAAAMVGLHHPVASYKRISFGHRLPDATYTVEGTLAPGNLFYQVGWDKGRVEHGSSGSPIFTAPGVVVGFLSYALMSDQLTVCQIEPSFAGYGRMSNVYANVSDYLENLPAADVLPANDVTYNVTNGLVAPAAQTVKLTTQSPGNVAFKLRSDAAWIRLSASSGTASASAPSSVTITVDATKFDRPGTYQSTVTILAGAAAPQFINVRAVVTVDRSNVVASVSANPALVSDASPLYSFKIHLDEKNGFATRLTSVHINGYDFSGSISDWFGGSLIPAKGSIEARLSTDYPFPPGRQYFEFWGVDEGTGRRWYVTAEATF